jgi:membrane associated rhomboid family serine protease
MNAASVGFHCPECVKAGRQKVHTGVSLFHSRPVVTQTLIAANVAAFVVGLSLGDGLFGSVGPDGLLVHGALFGPFVALSGDWYRVITSGFLHYGLFHIAFNMYALWILGPQAERSLGSVRFGLVYLLGLVAGSLGAMINSPNALTAGASGAIFGLFGLAVVNQRSLGRSIWDSGLGPILLLNLLLTLRVSSVSVGGHLGGFAGGLLAGWIVYQLPRRAKLPRWSQESLLAVLCVAGFVATIAVAKGSV